MAEIEAKEVVKEISPTMVKKSEVEAQAEEIRAKRTLPKKPGDVVTFSEACDWLKILTPEMQSRILLYVYRLIPVINRQYVDPQASNSIDIISDGFSTLTQDYFVNTHGGGKYKIIVFDSGNKELQRNGFFSATLDIPMLDCPPKLELREVDWDDSKNKGYKSWCRAKRLIDENNMPTIEKKDGTATTAGGDNTVALMKMFMEFTSKMDEKQQDKVKVALAGNDGIGKGISDILLERMKQDDPTKIVTIVSTLMSAMKSNEPKVVPATDPLASILPFMQMMQESSNKNFTLMLTMIDKMNNSGGGNVKEVDDTERLKNLLEIAKMMKGGGAPAERSVTEQLIEAGAAILPGVFNIVGNIVAMNAAKMGVPNSGPVPIPTNITSTSQAMADAKAAGQPQQQLNGLPAPTGDSQMKMALQQFAPLIIKALENGKPGWEFAVDVENMFGAPTVSYMVKDGVDPLIAIAKSMPEFWNAQVNIYGEPHLRQWVKEFVNYKEESEKMEEQGEEEKG
jgi:hypothetical protein